MNIIAEGSRHNSAFGCGEELEPVRAALEAQGHNWRLANGANIFAYPQQFAAASAALMKRELWQCHIVVDPGGNCPVAESKRYNPAFDDAIYTGHSGTPLRNRSAAIEYMPLLSSHAEDMLMEFNHDSS